MGVLQEFKKFAMRGNVIDMAVGIIIGAAFTKIVNSLVKDIIMPPLGLLTGKMDFSQKTFTMMEEGANGEPVVIGYGLFINSLIDFVIVAFVIFLVIRQMNKMTVDQAKPEEPSEPTQKECPKCLMQVPFHATKCGHCTADI